MQCIVGQSTKRLCLLNNVVAMVARAAVSATARMPDASVTAGAAATPARFGRAINISPRIVTYQRRLAPASQRTSSPADLLSERHVRAFTSHAVDEGRVAVERNMVLAGVPNGSVHHAIRGKGKNSPDDATSQDVIPVVRLVDRKRTGNQAGAKNRQVDKNQLPQRRVVVGVDFELGVEIEIEKDSAGKDGGRVSTREALQGVLDGILVLRCADLVGEHVLLVSDPVEPCSVVNLLRGELEIGLADVVKVGTETSDQPLYDDLKGCRGDDRVEQAKDAIVDVPKTADADQVHEQDRDDRNGDGKQGVEPRGNDLATVWVGELRVDNFTRV